MIAMLRPICSANTSFRDCGAMPASRFLSMDLFRSWNLKCCNRREIAGTKAETRYFNVTVLGSPLPSHVYHLQRSPLSSALRSYTTNLFTICLTVVSHPVSLVDFPSFTVCYVRVSLSSSMYGYTSSIFLCKKGWHWQPSFFTWVWHTSRTVDSIRWMEGRVHWLPLKDFIGPPCNPFLHTDNNDNFSLHWINFERRSATARGHKGWSAATGFEPEPFFARP